MQWNRQWYNPLQVFALVFFCLLFVKVVELENSSYQPITFPDLCWYLASPRQGRCSPQHGSLGRVKKKDSCCCGKFSQQASVSACPKVGMRVDLHRAYCFSRASCMSHHTTPLYQWTKDQPDTYYAPSIDFHTGGIKVTKVRVECLSLLAASQVVQTSPESPRSRSNL